MRTPNQMPCFLLVIVQRTSSNISEKSALTTFKMEFGCNPFRQKPLQVETLGFFGNTHGSFKYVAVTFDRFPPRRARTVGDFPSRNAKGTVAKLRASSEAHVDSVRQDGQHEFSSFMIIQR